MAAGCFHRQVVSPSLLVQGVDDLAVGDIHVLLQERGAIAGLRFGTMVDERCPPYLLPLSGDCIVSKKEYRLDMTL